MKYPTQNRLKELFNYNPKTGVLTRKITVSHNALKGDVFGHYGGHGYLVGTVNKVKHQLHRLIWIYYHGGQAPTQIDHINGIRTDNSIINLRKSSHAENSRNTRRKSTNKSGISGVFWRKDRQKYQVKVEDNGSKIILGSFSNIFDAACVKFSYNNNNGYTKRHGR